MSFLYFQFLIEKDKDDQELETGNWFDQVNLTFLYERVVTNMARFRCKTRLHHKYRDSPHSNSTYFTCYFYRLL